MLKIEKLNNVLTGFLTNVLGTVSMFGVTIFLTRTVDPAVYGEFRLAFSFISLMVILLLLGRDNGVVFFCQKLGKKNEEEKNHIISQESFYALLVFIVGLGILYFFRTYIIDQVFSGNISPENYNLSLLMLPLWGWFNMGISALRVKEYINYSFTLQNLFQRLIRIPFFVALVYLSQSFFSLTFSMILSQIILLLIIMKKVPWITYFKKVKLKYFFKRFSYSIQLGLSSIIFVALSRIDVIMIGKFTTTENVAVYDICIMLSMVVLFPYTALVKASEPVVKSILEDKNKMKNYQNNLDMAVAIATVVVLVFITNVDLILSIFGKEYINGGTPLKIMGIGYLLISFLGSPIEFLNMTGFVKKSLFVLLSSLILNITLNYLFIPRYGLNGAACATVFSLLSTKIIALFIVKHKLGLKLVKWSSFRQLIPFVFLSIIYLYVSSIIDNTMWLNLIFGLIAVVLSVVISVVLNDNLKKKAVNLLNF